MCTCLYGSEQPICVIEDCSFSQRKKANMVKNGFCVEKKQVDDEIFRLKFVTLLNFV